MHKSLPLLLFFMAAFSFTGKSQCSYVAQPGPTDGIDAVCHRYPLCGTANAPCDTTNRSTSKHIYAAAKQLGGVVRVMRSFVKFDLSDFGKIDATALPNSATLNLYYYRNALSGDEHLMPSDNAFYIERIVTDWKDDTIRWAYPAGTGNLRMPEVTKLTGTANQILVPPTGTPTKDVTIDMTDMVRFWLENPDSNFGFRIRLVNETTERQVHFCSSDYDDAQYRPKLSIDFPTVIASAGVDTLVCAGSSIRLQGSGGAQYKWTPVTSGADILSKYDIPNPILKSTKAQTFEVEVKIGSCSDKDQVFIDYDVPRPAKISKPANDTFLCPGESIQLEAAGGTFFKWSPSDVLNADDITSPICTPTESVMIYVSTNSAGDKCPGKDSVYIEMKDMTVASLSFHDTTICKGDSVQVVATAGKGATFLWSPADSVNDAKIANPIIYVRGTTQLIVKIEDVNACPVQDTIVVKVVESVAVDAGSDMTICAGDTIELNAKGTGTFSWNNTESLSDPFIANPKAFPYQTTTYVLKLSGSSCVGTDSLTITVNPRPEITATDTEQTVCAGDEVTLSATGTSFYWWNTGESSDKIIIKIDDPNKTQVYKVVGNDGACESDTIYFNITSQRCGAPYVLMPKFFSPNGDGINDYLIVKDIRKYENEIIIINKWGDIVYRKSNYDNRWDGTYNGQQVAEDTYMYIVRVKVENDWKEEKGTLTILRTRN